MGFIHTVVVWVDLAVHAFLLGGICAWRNPLARALGGPRRSGLALLAVLAGVHVFCVKPFLPHTVWHEQHAAGILAGTASDLFSGGFDAMHGPTYSIIMTLARRATFDGLSVFSLNYFCAVLSAFVLFIFLRCLTGEDAPAIAASAMLLFLPVHMRLSTTESLFVLVECLWLLSYLLLAVFLRTQDIRAFQLALGALILLMHTRAELFLFAPILCVVFLWIFRADLPARIWGRRAYLQTAATAGLLCLPRFIEIVLSADPRSGIFSTNSWRAHYGELGISGINAFFDPGFTPVSYLVLFLLGLVCLKRRQPRLSLYLSLHCILLTYFYTLHLDSVSIKVRTSLATQFAFVSVAAYGGCAIADRLRKFDRRLPLLLLACLLVSAVVPHQNFLTKLYIQQQEYAFLQRTAQLLPPQSVIVYLSDSDEPDVLQSRDNWSDVLSAGAPPVLVGIRQFLKSADRINWGDVYFYEGSECFTPPWTPGETEHGPPPEGYTHPLCLRMRQDFAGEPAATALLSGDTLRWDDMSGDKRRIGLYRLSTPQRNQHEPAWRHFDPIRAARTDADAAAGIWLRAAEYLVRMRMRRPALGALWVARRFSPSQPWGIVKAYLDLPDHTRALTYAETYAAAPEEAGPLVLLARTALICGDTARARAALSAAVNLNPSARDRERMAILYQDLGDHANALAAFDDLIREFPWEARYKSGRGVLLAIMGKERLENQRRSTQ